MLSALLLSAAMAPQGPPEVGEPFPLLPFPVLGEEGTKTLQDWRGQKVLLAQFASW